MRRKWIYLLMAVISTMLVVLIIIQVMWLLGASRADKREKQIRVNAALSRVSEQLSDNSSCFESYGKAYVDVGERFYMLHIQKDGKADTVDIYYDEAFTRDKKVGVLNSMKLGSPFSIDIQLRSYVVAEDTARYVSQKKAFYQGLNGMTLKDIIRNKKPIDSLFSMKAVDSLVRVSLELENADTVFGFGLIDLDRNKINYHARVNDTSDLRRSACYVSLFTDNSFMTPYKLVLLFSDTNSVFSINYLLLLSVLVILLLTFSFYTFVRLYLRQDRLSKMKSDFIHNLTHEFNTPMANISLALETLNDSGKYLDVKTRNVINIISAESARLRENIERSLQVAIMEEDGLMLRKEQVDLVQLLNVVITSYALQCEALGGSLIFKYTADPVIFADETHLLNCVVNLLDNAIKYRSKEPVITISIEEKNSEVLLIISDNGIGMNTDTQKHIFDKFYRAHEGNTHNTKGFGLGLSYVKGIIDAHEGTIEVSSRKGAGARFVIRLPITTVNDGKK